VLENDQRKKQERPGPSNCCDTCGNILLTYGNSAVTNDMSWIRTRCQSSACSKYKQEYTQHMQYCAMYRSKYAMYTGSAPTHSRATVRQAYDGTRGTMDGAYGAISTTRTEGNGTGNQYGAPGHTGIFCSRTSTGQSTSATRLNLAATQGPTSDPFQYYTDPDTVYHHMIRQLYSQPLNRVFLYGGFSLDGTLYYLSPQPSLVGCVCLRNP
jgi:hypothetical protein